MSNKKDGLKYEKIVAKALMGYTSFEDIVTTIASGAMWFDKEDLKGKRGNQDYIIQVKGTKKDKYRLSSEDVYKVWNNAYDAGGHPYFVIVFAGKFKYQMVLLNVKYVTDKIEYVCKKSYLFKESTTLEFASVIIKYKEDLFEVTFDEVLFINK